MQDTCSPSAHVTQLVLPDHIILGQGYEEGQEGKILESSWQSLVPEEKFLAPVPVVEQDQTSSQHNGNSWECHGSQESHGISWCVMGPHLRALNDQTLPCPLCSLQPELHTRHLRAAGFTGLKLRVPLKPRLSPTPPKFSANPISPQIQGGQGGCWNNWLCL